MANGNIHSDGNEPTGPVATSAGRSIEPTTMPPQPSIPEHIHHYRILRKLGAGGMGAVFEAEQQNPKRLVALKVINAGVVSREALRRFQHEAQVLGRLHHSGIAQIYEAGTFDSGEGARPFFAMELIRGEVITVFAQNHDLDRNARLNLLALVCDAVQHAHLKGIIHRDLKPGNILVTHEGQPKVLDFGVARATDADVRATTLHTRADQLIGTLPYMSPEQAQGDSNELDMRSDVYALGVLGYELLTGRLPYQLDRRTVYEAVRVIKEEEPTRLSDIDRQYRGDVETIFAKALEKDRARRYQSAADFAGDIRRFLADQPIVARPPSVAYRMRKFARRNKALVIGLTAVLLALIAGVVASTMFAVREARAHRWAQLEADKALAISNFHRSMLSRANPAFAQGRDVTVREVLDQASREVGSMFPGQPQLEATLRGTIAESYLALSEYRTAAEQFQRSAELLRTNLGENDLDTLTAEGNLAVAWRDLGRLDEAIAMARSVLQRSQETLGHDHEHTIGSAVNLALALAVAGKADEAVPLLRSSLQRASRTLGEGNRVTLTSMVTLATVLKNQGHFDEATSLYERAIAQSRRWLGENDHDTLAALDNFAGLLQLKGEHARAREILTQLLDTHTAIFGPTHAATLIVRNNLAITLQNEGQLSQAEEMFASVVKDGRERFGEDHPDVLLAMSNLAGLYFVQGRLAEAEQMLQETVEAQVRTIGESHPETITAMSKLAIVLGAQDKNDQAEPWHRRALEATQRTLGPEHPQTLTAEAEFASFLRDVGQYEAADRQFTQTLATLRRTLGSQADATIAVIYQYVGLLQRMQRWEEALPLSKELMQSASLLARGDPFALLAPMRHGRTLTGLGRFQEAEEALMESLRRLDAVEGTSPQWKGYVIEALIDLYDVWGKPDEVAAWRTRLENAAKGQ